jgi:hypothetical protein
MSNSHLSVVLEDTNARAAAQFPCPHNADRHRRKVESAPKIPPPRNGQSSKFQTPVRSPRMDAEEAAHPNPPDAASPDPFVLDPQLEGNAHPDAKPLDVASSNPLPDSDAVSAAPGPADDSSQPPLETDGDIPHLDAADPSSQSGAGPPNQTCNAAPFPPCPDSRPATQSIDGSPRPAATPSDRQAAHYGSEPRHLPADQPSLSDQPPPATLDPEVTEPSSQAVASDGNAPSSSKPLPPLSSDARGPEGDGQS